MSSSFALANDAANVEQTNLRQFTGFGAYYSGPDPDLIDDHYRFSSIVDDFERPIAFQLILNVRLTDDEDIGELSLCGQSLNVEAAAKAFQTRVITAPFQSFAEELADELNGQVVSNGKMVLSIRSVIVDVRSALSEGAPTSYCLVRTKTELAERGIVDPLTGNEYPLEPGRARSLPPVIDASLFTGEHMYFVSPQHLRATLEIEFADFLRQIIPTINGEIDDECGYFKLDPGKQCARHYRFELLEAREALRCASEESDRAAIRKKIDAIEAKLTELPAHVEQSRHKSNLRARPQCTE